MMHNWDLLVVTVTWLCGTIGSTLAVQNGGDTLTRLVRDLGFRDDSSRRGGRSCRPRHSDDDEDQPDRRQINKCCRRYGDDFDNPGEGRWQRSYRDRFDDDDDDEESRFERRRRRFWRRFCRRYGSRTSDPGETGRRRVTDEGAGVIDPDKGFRPPGSQERKSAPKAAAKPPVQKSVPRGSEEDGDGDPEEGPQQGEGQSAAAGNANVGKGSGTSINQANQKSNPFGNLQSALSANAGTGKDVGLDGAAQAKGAFQNARGASKGTAAAAGKVDVKEGQGISINKADHQSNARGVIGSSISANSATGKTANAGGAATAGGANARRPTSDDDDTEE